MKYVSTPELRLMSIFFVDQGYNLCSSLYPTGNDSCYDCPNGTFNHFPVNTAYIMYSYEEELCMKIDCDCLPGENPPPPKKRERFFNSPGLKAQKSFSNKNLSIVVVVIKFSQFYLLLKNLG